MSKKANHGVSDGSSDVPQGAPVDHVQREWEGRPHFREGDKGDEAKMTVTQCKCSSGELGLMIPSKDKVHCDWCGRDLFKDFNAKHKLPGEVGLRQMRSIGGPSARIPLGVSGTKTMLEMRSFAGGATRSSQEGKPEFAGFLSPIATRRFGKYMMVHQVQEDGKLRKSDNWKSGMSRRAYVESLKRHFLDVEEIVTGDVVSGTDVGQERLEEALCAMFFNVQGLLREVMLKRDVGEAGG